MRTDEDLRRALHDLAEAWGDTTGVEARIRHRQGRRRRRLVALAAAAAAIVGALTIPQVLGPDDHDRSLIADDGTPPPADDCVVDGPATIAVPDVTGLGLGQAIDAIRAAGLTVIGRGVPGGDPTEDAANVTSQAPSAGEVLPPGGCVGFRTKLGTGEGLPDLQAAAPGREITFEGIGDVRLGDVLDPEAVTTLGEGDDCGSWGPVEPSHDGDEPLQGEVTGASTPHPRVIRIRVWQNPAYRTASGIGVGTRLETLQRIYGDRLVIDRADGWESPTDGLLASYTDVAAVRVGDAALTYYLRDDVVDVIKLSPANDWGDDEGCA